MLESGFGMVLQLEMAETHAWTAWTLDYVYQLVLKIEEARKLLLS